MLGYPLARLAFGAALGLALAALVELPLRGQEDSVRVLAICALAAVVALLAPRLRDRPGGRGAVDVGLAALVAVAAPEGPGRAHEGSGPRLPRSGARCRRRARAGPG